ncbi:DUF5004 domain-containing protein [Flagellimonas crocea]|uniref:DUF5004 domain-containing protein n=1 Tax=Flagellimonas crocea TaxID=3067311 RepID=UPI00296F08B2|nr:DUF5004 domain-containing protein [Muricauda sp. DH64]
MKNIKLFLMSIGVLSTVLSCSDDDGNDNGGFSVEALVGTWDLVEVKLSSAVDLDGDGQSSDNLLDEEDCISGTIIFNADTTYKYEQSSFTISFITNDQYYVACSGTNLATGAWGSDGNEVAFQGSSTLGVLQLSNNTIIKNVGDDLPGVLSYVYLKR